AVERVEVDHSRAGFQHAIVKDDEGRRIRQQEADFDPFADADLLQTLGGAFGKLADLGKTQAFAHEVGARAPAVGRNGIVEEGPHEPRGKFRIPYDPWKIRLEQETFGKRVLAGLCAHRRKVLLRCQRRPSSPSKYGVFLWFTDA